MRPSSHAKQSAAARHARTRALPQCEAETVWVRPAARRRGAAQVPGCDRAHCAAATWPVHYTQQCSAFPVGNSPGAWPSLPLSLLRPNSPCRSTAAGPDWFETPPKLATPAPHGPHAPLLRARGPAPCPEQLRSDLVSPGCGYHEGRHNPAVRARDAREASRGRCFGRGGGRAGADRSQESK